MGADRVHSLEEFQANEGGRDSGRHVIGPGARDPAHEGLVGRPELVDPLARSRGNRLTFDQVRDLVGDYHADQPPSTTTLAPVTYDDASDARNTTAPSASLASSMRPIGTRAA